MDVTSGSCSTVVCMASSPTGLAGFAVTRWPEYFGRIGGRNAKNGLRRERMPRALPRARRLVGSMRQRQVLLALHLDQARFGAAEFGTVAFAVIQLGDRRGGREHQLDVAVVELIYQQHEALGGILAVDGELRHVGDDH